MKSARAVKGSNKKKGLVCPRENVCAEVYIVGPAIVQQRSRLHRQGSNNVLYYKQVIFVSSTKSLECERMNSGLRSADRETVFVCVCERERESVCVEEGPRGTQRVLLRLQAVCVRYYLLAAKLGCAHVRAPAVEKCVHVWWQQRGFRPAKPCS